METHAPNPEGVTGYRADIDGLRAVAITMVMGYHAFLLRGGFTGVDIFFVISGYLISGIILEQLRSGTFSFSSFYLRRIRRLLPALLALCVASFVAGWLLLTPENFRQLGKHIACGAFFVSDFMAWQETFRNISQNNPFKPLSHLWSLSIEEQFYLVWPLALYLAHKNQWNALHVILVTGLSSFALNIYTGYRDAMADYFLPFTRLWELMMGAALSIIPPSAIRFRNAFYKLMPAIVGLLLIIQASSLRFSELFSYPGYAGLAPTAGAWLLIASGPDTWFHRHALGNPLMVWIGRISYPLYLWHWPLFAYLDSRYPGVIPPRQYTAAVIAASVALAWLTYRYIECPIRSRTFGLPLAIQLAAGLGAIGIIGLITNLTDGFTLSGLPEAH